MNTSFRFPIVMLLCMAAMIGTATAWNPGSIHITECEQTGYLTPLHTEINTETVQLFNPAVGNIQVDSDGSYIFNVNPNLKFTTKTSLTFKDINGGGHSVSVTVYPCTTEEPEPEEVLPDNYCDGFAVVVKSPMDMQEFGVGDTVQVVTGNNAQNCDFRVRLFVDGASAPSSTMQFYEPGEYEIEAVATDTNPASPMYGEIISSDSVTISVIE
jgi:hypothetical protein